MKDKIVIIGAGLWNTSWTASAMANIIESMLDNTMYRQYESVAIGMAVGVVLRPGFSPAVGPTLAGGDHHHSHRWGPFSCERMPARHRTARLSHGVLPGSVDPVGSDFPRY